MSELRRAAFLDRDGTIIVDRDYPGDPEAVELLPGAAEAIRKLSAAGLVTIVVTNQSGIGRGLITEADFRAVQGRMEELLAQAGATLDAVYFCPHAPDQPCECRKPRPGLYRRAAAEHGLDLARSVYIGDRMRDVLPGEAFGGSGYLIRGTESDPPQHVRSVASLLEATELLLDGGVSAG